MRFYSSLLTLAGVLAIEAEAVRFLGRVNPATRELTWPGTGLTFTFTGTSASIGIESVTGTNSAELVIDDGEPIFIPNVEGSSISTPEGLTYGNHSVVLRKRSSNQFGTVFVGDVLTDGTFGCDTAPSRQIDIIGDSISVGYGLDGVLPCVNTAVTENAVKTYGALAAKALKADYSIVAWSGKGLIRNIATGSPDDSPLMPELYNRYGAQDAENSYTFPKTWTPDAVVINLGTNDFSYLAYDENGQSYEARERLDIAAFTAGMVEFVQEIQTHYPDAEFFLLSSPMLGDGWPPGDLQHTKHVQGVTDAIAQLGDKVHFLDWPSQGSDVGCDYHPNAATNAEQAEVLAATIGAVLGW